MNAHVRIVDRSDALEPIRVIPIGADRAAYRKVQRAVRKLQKKIDAGTLTEEEAMQRLGLEAE